MGLNTLAIDNSLPNAPERDKNTAYVIPSTAAKTIGPKINILRSVREPLRYAYMTITMTFTMKMILVPCKRLMPFKRLSSKNRDLLYRVPENRTRMDISNRHSAQNMEKLQMPLVISPV